MGSVQAPERLVLPDGKQWFSLSEVAKAVGRHKLTVYRWEKEDLIPKPQRVPLGLRAIVKMRRYSREQVMEIWAKMTQAA